MLAGIHIYSRQLQLFDPCSVHFCMHRYFQVQIFLAFVQLVQCTTLRIYCSQKCVDISVYTSYNMFICLIMAWWMGVVPLTALKSQLKAYLYV